MKKVLPFCQQFDIHFSKCLRYDMYNYLQYFPPVVLGKSQLLLIQGVQGSSGYSRFLLFYAMFAINQVHLNIGG